MGVDGRAGNTPEAATSAAPWEPHCPVTRQGAPGPITWERMGAHGGQSCTWVSIAARLRLAPLLGWHHDQPWKTGSGQDNRPGQLFPRLVILIFPNDLMLIDYRHTAQPRSCGTRPVPLPQLKHQLHKTLGRQIGRQIGGQIRR